MTEGVWCSSINPQPVYGSGCRVLELRFPGHRSGRAGTRGGSATIALFSHLNSQIHMTTPACQPGKSLTDRVTDRKREKQTGE